MDVAMGRDQRPKIRYYYDPEFEFDARGIYSNHLRAERPTHPTYARRQEEIAPTLRAMRFAEDQRCQEWREDGTNIDHPVENAPSQRGVGLG